MASLGRYCKAYPVARLREFSGWVENLENLREDRPTSGAADGAETRVLADDDYLYLQEDFNVTDGVFIDTNLIYEGASPEWREFCTNQLEFKVPDLD